MRRIAPLIITSMKLFILESSKNVGYRNTGLQGGFFLAKPKSLLTGILPMDQRKIVGQIFQLTPTP